MTLRRRLAHLLSYWAVLLDPDPETIDGMDSYEAFVARLADERRNSVAYENCRFDGDVLQKAREQKAGDEAEHRDNVRKIK